MSSVLGRPGERWRLSQAMDELGESVRRAARPSWLWIAGLIAPSVEYFAGIGRTAFTLLDKSTGLDFGFAQGKVEVPAAITPNALGSLISQLPWPALLEQSGGLLLVALAALGLWLLALPFARLLAGLQAIAPPRVWSALEREHGRARLRDAWQAGQGLAASGFALIFAPQLLLVGALFALLGPLVMLLNLLAVESFGALIALALVPLLVAISSYAVLLVVLCLLALHSLAQNRRGAASALVHAWRLVRNDPWASARAGLADLLLASTVYFAQQALLHTPVIGEIGLVLLTGLAGVARACYWAKVYSALGGLGPADGLPGSGALVATPIPRAG
jgi:hypothetical protein